jgi:acyl carrier protein
MSKASTIDNQITRIFEEKLHLEIPSADTDLFETGGLDSMAFVDLLRHLELEFGITMSLDELEIDSFRSIERIAEFVASRNGQNSHLEAVQKGGEGRT